MKNIPNSAHLTEELQDFGDTYIQLRPEAEDEVNETIEVLFGSYAGPLVAPLVPPGVSSFVIDGGSGVDDWLKLTQHKQ